ncbi:hypothetical protein CUMW_092970 [Citrus unshiu]|nr:hypothetical protein CUMW_092970 [Citrus unshiu]
MYLQSLLQLQASQNLPRDNWRHLRRRCRQPRREVDTQLIGVVSPHLVFEIQRVTQRVVPKIGRIRTPPILGTDH